MNEDTTQTSEEDVKVEAEETTEANPQETGAEITENPTEENADESQDVDYKVKFSESSKEALRLRERDKENQAEIERLTNLSKEEISDARGDDSENLYPGFENLSEEEQNNLVAYTDSIKKSALEGIYKDPAIAYAKQSYNERTWDSAFDKVTSEFPDLKESKDEFKSKYFKADNVPTNIDDILKDVAKIYLYDKAKDTGAKEALERADRIDTERSSGGDRTPTATRSLEDWNVLAQSNPAEFAKHSKQFNEDMASGKLK